MASPVLISPVLVSPVLVIGQSGQLARALMRQGTPVVTTNRRQLDLALDPREFRSNLKDLIKIHRPCGIINAAAYTQVDTAETDRRLAFQINADAPTTIADLCTAFALPFVHISTDYVFNGAQSRPWRETDHPDPINVYGESKLAGEQRIQDIGGVAAILRTSWVYDTEGQNFLTTMLRLAQTHSELRIVDNQIGRPTHADVLAKAALDALGHNGLYHVSGTGDPVSWAGFAAAIFTAATQDISVVPISSSDYPTAAKRPAYSVLDTSKFEANISALPDWRDSLRRTVIEMDLSNP